MLLIQFSTMVIDRALYLRKTVLGKLAFQVVLVLAIHLWMFFILPAVTERRVGGGGQASLLRGAWEGCLGSRDVGAPATGLRWGGLTGASCPSQDVQPEYGGPAVVLCEVHLLRPVRLPDPLRLPHPHPRQLPHQEVQPPQPLPLPGVSTGRPRRAGLPSLGPS